jgi:hypothetical protein
MNRCVAANFTSHSAEEVEKEEMMQRKEIMREERERLIPTLVPETIDSFHFLLLLLVTYEGSQESKKTLLHQKKITGYQSRGFPLLSFEVVENRER